MAQPEYDPTRCWHKQVSLRQEAIPGDTWVMRMQRGMGRDDGALENIWTAKRNYGTRPWICREPKSPAQVPEPWRPDEPCQAQEKFHYPILDKISCSVDDEIGVTRDSFHLPPLSVSRLLGLGSTNIFLKYSLACSVRDVSAQARAAAWSPSTWAMATMFIKILS